MIGVGLYSCSSDDKPSPLSKIICAWPRLRFRFFGLGTGVMRSDRRRLPMILLVGWPSASNSQCQPGESEGELRIGRSRNEFVVPLGRPLLQVPIRSFCLDAQYAGL